MILSAAGCIDSVAILIPSVDNSLKTSLSSEDSPVLLLISDGAIVCGFCSGDADAMDKAYIKSKIMAIEAKAIERAFSVCFIYPSSFPSFSAYYSSELSK
ncbi:hypothetical protein MSBR3_2117 [Methanosarcina barkeri 3]|uniref:Uncharacterized protein n=1 Tax=Methanosarcina barkeri 3 TaxID=1434107 RepID=A0A0E3WYP4_METBA|nr:hypothetical protein MSBR3_2117 [Methanosarcina barkeri 3]